MLDTTWYQIIWRTRAGAKAFLLPCFLSWACPIWISAPLNVLYILAWYRVIAGEIAHEVPAEPLSQIWISAPLNVLYILAWYRVIAGEIAHEVPAEPLSQTTKVLPIITGSLPSRIYHNEGDSCCVCLECFDESIANVPVQDLLTLSPPLAPLRCGHVLHLTCAEAVIGARSASRKAKCPVCRRVVCVNNAVSNLMFA